MLTSLLKLEQYLPVRVRRSKQYRLYYCSHSVTHPVSHSFGRRVSTDFIQLDQLTSQSTRKSIGQIESPPVTERDSSWDGWLVSHSESHSLINSLTLSLSFSQLIDVLQSDKSTGVSLKAADSLEQWVFLLTVNPSTNWSIMLYRITVHWSEIHVIYLQK